MKQVIHLLIVASVLIACNHNAEEKTGVGDSVQVDPTTAQPITTEPDTVGPNATDTIQTQNN